MKKYKTLRNVAAALGVFLFWGNVASLLLPAEEYGAVIKAVDFITAFVLLVVLIVAAYMSIKKRRQKEEPEK